MSSKDEMQNLKKLIEEELSNVDPEVLKDLMSKMSSKAKIQIQTKSISEDFEKFLGFWQSTSSSYFNNILIEFYDNEGVMSARYYTGTPQNFREYNNNDDEDISPSPVSIIDSNAVLIETNALPASSLFEPYITFRIQEDGSGIIDYFDTEGGRIYQVTKYEKLEETPVIQRTDEPSLVDWNDPIEIARYVYEYYGGVVGPQKADDLHDADYVGREKYDENFQQLLNTGWVRTATTSSAFRGGKHIGVWKTQYSGSFPVTTLHTAEPHKFNAASVLEITGFSGPFSILNGEHRVSLAPTSTVNANPPYPWANENSFEYLVMVDVDTSGIVEDYNPLTHGFGQLKSVHDPITSETEYKSMMASLYDFVITSFGESTHNRLQPWVVDGQIPETFEELNLALKNGSASLTTMRMRTYQSNGTAVFYHNYQVKGNSSSFPVMNINDPYGLGDVQDKPEFDIDIDVENYLQEEKRFSLFYTVTGDPFSSPTITFVLGFLGIPRGDTVVYKVAPFQQVPEPLEEELGTHPYRYYGAFGSAGTSDSSSHNNFVCGIVKKSKTKNCETVAYIRIVNESGTDGRGILASFPPVFGVDGISNKATGFETIAMATVLEELNKYKPSKYIIDTRENGGGNPTLINAWASLFGENRINTRRYLTNVADDSVPIQSITGSGYESGNNTLQSTSVIQSTINTDEIAALYPQSMVRSNDPKKKLQVVILTSTHAASAGDMLPHGFIGPDPTATVHDLGYNVESTIVCDVNGILDGASRTGDAVAVDTLGPRLTNVSGAGITPLYMTAECDHSFWDRIGPYNNFTTQVIPDKLLETWYDNAQWRDIGLIEGKVEYPIRGKLPERSDNTTWRDYQLEEAIAHRSTKKSKCQCKSCKNRYCKKRC